MAKRKATQKNQPKTNNQQKYERYYKAIKVLQRYDEEIPTPKELKKAQKKSVTNIEKEYRKARAKVKKEVDELPSLKELEDYYDTRQTLPPPDQLEYGEEFVNDLWEHIITTYNDSVSSIVNPKVRQYWQDKSEPLINEAKGMLDSIIEAAGRDYELLADLIKAQPDYELIMATDYISPSNLEQYGETCVQFFTAVMIDVQSTLWG